MNTLLIKPSKRQSNRASALIAVLAILAIMFILFKVNSKTLLRLSHEVDAVNKKQTNHWAAVSAQHRVDAQKP